MGTRAVLDALQEGQIPVPYRESNHNPSDVQPVTLSPITPSRFLSKASLSFNFDAVLFIVSCFVE